MLIRADARAIPLKDETVQCVVTSPPYWGLRVYKDIGNRGIGLEPTMDEYIAHMVEAFREVKRVLRSDGTVFLNLGDTYNSNQHNHNWLGGKGIGAESLKGRTISSLKPKDLCGLPWRVAFALQNDGWWLRSDIIWAKPNPMPESVTDRPTKAHEYIFLLTKAEHYYYDAETVKERGEGYGRSERFRDQIYTQSKCPSNDADYGKTFGGGKSSFDGSGRNLRSVWTIPTQANPVKHHYATFPERIPEICIKAGTSEKGCCPKCGKGWERVVKTRYESHGISAKAGGGYAGGNRRSGDLGFGKFRPQEMPFGRASKINETLGWQVSCNCNAGDPRRCIVLDPFAGTATTVAVARRLGRIGIGLDLTYQALAAERVGGPLFASVVNSAWGSSDK